MKIIARVLSQLRAAVDRAPVADADSRFNGQRARVDWSSAAPNLKPQVVVAAPQAHGGLGAAVDAYAQATQTLLSVANRMNPAAPQQSYGLIKMHLGTVQGCLVRFDALAAQLPKDDKGVAAAHHLLEQAKNHFEFGLKRAFETNARKSIALAPDSVSAFFMSDDAYAKAAAKGLDPSAFAGFEVGSGKQGSKRYSFERTVSLNGQEVILSVRPSVTAVTHLDPVGKHDQRAPLKTSAVSTHYKFSVEIQPTSTEAYDADAAAAVFSDALNLARDLVYARGLATWKDGYHDSNFDSDSYAGHESGFRNVFEIAGAGKVQHQEINNPPGDISGVRTGNEMIRALVEVLNLSSAVRAALRQSTPSAFRRTTHGGPLV